MGEALVTLVTFVIVDLYTVIVEDRLLPAAVFKTVQVDLYAGAVKTADLVEQVEYTPVIDRERHVKTHNM
jgi:hypothetical protein